MNKHTEGPWVYAYGSVYREAGLGYESASRIAVMDRHNPKTTPTERDANAVLMAAAPAMLEMLEELRAVLRAEQTFSDSPDDWTTWIKDIDEVLAKAKGEER